MVSKDNPTIDANKSAQGIPLREIGLFCEDVGYILFEFKKHIRN